jgi:hypothetical protein
LGSNGNASSVQPLSIRFLRPKLDLNCAKRGQTLLPGFTVSGYSVSRDRQRVACAVLDSTGKSHVWVAPLDRGKPPERIRSADSESEDTPILAGNGDLLFRASANGSKISFG